MLSFRTHLTVLAESAALYPSSPVFKTPLLDDKTKEIISWQSITYSQFHADVEKFATYWARTLGGNGLPQRSVVGVWLGGMTYLDVVHIYGIVRAGYIPQMFSLRLPNPDMIYELLRKANAKALIHEFDLGSMLTNSPIPTHVAIDARTADLQGAPLPPMVQPASGSDTIMIFHTSGSTSGSPKLIRCSYTWLGSIIEKAGLTGKSIRPMGHDVTVWMGSVCHIGQTSMLLGSLQNAACTIQPTQIAFSSDELLDMITRCGLNRLNQFPAFLGIHMRNSRQSPKLLAQLCALDEIIYSGQPMPREDEEWAYQNNMQLRNLFGSTECAVMMLSVRGGGRPSPPVRPLPNTKYGFFPLVPREQPAEGYADANSQLLELVILSDSPDCPDPSLRQADGHYHTGDLFVEVAPGTYVNRGRDDDWIKSENCLRCDTRAIEDNARAACGALVADCIVVGNARPSPVLFVEPGVEMDEERLKREIIRRTRHFHARRYLHERITSPRMVVVVPPGTLPRTATKGNIRRRAVEEAFKAELDRIFSA